MNAIDKFVAALITLAIVAVVVSAHGQTSTAIQSAFSALISAVKALMSPIQTTSATGK